MQEQIFFLSGILWFNEFVFILFGIFLRKCKSFTSYANSPNSRYYSVALNNKTNLSIVLWASSSYKSWAPLECSPRYTSFMALSDSASCLLKFSFISWRFLFSLEKFCRSSSNDFIFKHNLSTYFSFNSSFFSIPSIYFELIPKFYFWNPKVSSFVLFSNRIFSYSTSSSCSSRSFFYLLYSNSRS